MSIIWGPCQVEVSYGEANTFLLQKFDARVERSQKYPHLKDLLSTPVVRINDMLLYTPIYYIDKIKNNPRLHAYLTPTQIGLCHGDLHFGNILVNAAGLYFIDPNSAAYMPIEYDYGRLLHSAHGRYAQIMNGDYSMTQHADGSYEYSVETSEKLEIALRHLQSNFTEQELLRGLYTEALHFATMLPNHVSDQKETTALFLRDVELFDDLFNHEIIRALL